MKNLFGLRGWLFTPTGNLHSSGQSRLVEFVFLVIALASQIFVVQRTPVPGVAVVAIVSTFAFVCIYRMRQQSRIQWLQDQLDGFEQIPPEAVNGQRAPVWPQPKAPGAAATVPHEEDQAATADDVNQRSHIHSRS